MKRKKHNKNPKERERIKVANYTDTLKGEEKDDPIPFSSRHLALYVLPHVIF